MMRLRAIIRKEMMLTLRSRRVFWLLLLTLTGCGAIYFSIWKGRQDTMFDAYTRALVARAIFLMLSMGEMVAFTVCASVLAAGALTIERERRTFDLIYCTGLRPLDLLLGKWLSVIAFLVLAIVMVLPIEALIFSLGGVLLVEYRRTAAVLIVAVLVYGMFGFCISSLARRSTTAVVTTTGVLLTWNIAAWALLFLLYLSMYGPRLVPNIGAIEKVCAASPFLVFYAIFQERLTLNPNSLNVIFRDFLGFHALLFIICALAAWLRLTIGKAMESEMPRPASSPNATAIARTARRRASRFGLNRLLEPLARWNPVLHREVLHGSIGRGRTLALLSALAFLFSLSSLAWLDFYVTDFCRTLAIYGIAACIFLLPAWAATAFTSERDDLTWDLLCVTPLSDRQIMLGKFAVYIKSLMTVTLAGVFLPLAISGIQHLRHDLWFFYLMRTALIMTLPAIIAYGLFAGSIMLYWSSRSPSNAVAMMSSYVTLIFLNLAPLWLVGNSMIRIFPHADARTWQDLAGHLVTAGPAALARQILAPLLSPFVYLTNHDIYLHAQDESLPTLLHLALSALLAAGVLWRAERHLRAPRGGRRSA